VGLGLSKNASVGLFSVNRAEWMMGEYACFMQSFITVPLYDTLGVEAIGNKISIIIQNILSIRLK
jgi:long-chain acyl-CoA synthetase